MKGYNKKAAKIACEVRNSGGDFTFFYKDDIKIRIYITDSLDGKESKGAIFAFDEADSKKKAVIKTIKMVDDIKYIRHGRIILSLLRLCVSLSDDIEKALNDNPAYFAGELLSRGFKTITM